MPTHDEMINIFFQNLATTTAEPERKGLLQRLADKDKELCQFKDLQDPFRQGFMLAESIVKKWAQENYPMNM